MAYKGRTKKPCHGCGEVPKSYEGGPIEGVCFDCAKLLKFAKKTQAANQAAKDLKTYRAPWAAHALPYLSHVRTSFGRTEGRPADIFVNSYFALIGLLSRPSDTWSQQDVPVIDGSDRSNQGGTVVMQPEVRDSLSAIHAAVRDMLEEAYEQGKLTGRNLLTGLASGEITVDTFNDVSTKLKKGRL